jgi:hypothetical protein
MLKIRVMGSAIDNPTTGSELLRIKTEAKDSANTIPNSMVMVTPEAKTRFEPVFCISLTPALRDRPALRKGA